MRAHKRNKAGRKAAVAAVALLFAGAGIAAVNLQASAGEGGGRPASQAGDVHGVGGQDGPDRRDFVDITRVPADVDQPRNGPEASTGTFTSFCGTDSAGRRNSTT